MLRPRVYTRNVTGRNSTSEPHESLQGTGEPATLDPVPVTTPDFGEPPNLKDWLEVQLLEGRPRARPREAGSGWTQEDLARACDVSLSAARSWLRGTHFPDYKQLHRLHVLFGSLPFCE